MYDFRLVSSSILYISFLIIFVCGKVKGPVLVEDTCLCFNALKGLPGRYNFLIFHAMKLDIVQLGTGFN